MKEFSKYLYARKDVPDGCEWGYLSPFIWSDLYILLMLRAEDCKIEGSTYLYVNKHILKAMQAQTL